MLAAIKNRAVFLDRDGVLVIPEFRDGRSYAPRRIEDFEIYPDAVNCLTDLNKHGFFLVVVTNQPDIGNGITTAETVAQMHRTLLDTLPIDDIRVCPHPGEIGCACRKPAPGMIFEAAGQLDIDLSASFMIGDRASDIIAGNSAGCRTIFLDHGYSAETPPDNPGVTVGSLRQATDWILTSMNDLGQA